MTDEQKRRYMDLMAATNETVMNVVCPLGTFALAIAVAITVPPCMFWLFWTLYG